MMFWSHSILSSKENIFYEKKFSELNKGCTILGVTDALTQIQVETFNYTSEFLLVCYTDGLTDTANAKNDNLTTDHLKEIISRNPSANPEFLNETILFYAEEFKGDNAFPDDIALLTLKVADLNF